MNLLLDTHIFLWGFLEPERLTADVVQRIENPDTTLWLSPISVWECLVLAAKGRIRLDPDPERWLHTALEKAPLREASLTHEIAFTSHRLPLPHNDPADRFIAATAVVHNLTLVTADKRMLGDYGCEVLANR